MENGTVATSCWWEACLRNHGRKWTLRWRWWWYQCPIIARRNMKQNQTIKTNSCAHASTQVDGTGGSGGFWFRWRTAGSRSLSTRRAGRSGFGGEQLLKSLDFTFPIIAIFFEAFEEGFGSGRRLALFMSCSILGMVVVAQAIDLEDQITFCPTNPIYYS